MCNLRTRGRKEKELSIYKAEKCFNQREAHLKALLEGIFWCPPPPCSSGCRLYPLFWGSGQGEEGR